MSRVSTARLLPLPTGKDVLTQINNTMDANDVGASSQIAGRAGILLYDLLQAHSISKSSSLSVTILMIWRANGSYAETGDYQVIIQMSGHRVHLTITFHCCLLLHCI